MNTSGKESEVPGAITPQLVISICVMAVYFGFIFFLLFRLNIEETLWARALYLFTGIETIVFAAVGYIFGRDVSRKSEAYLERRSTKADEDKEKALNEKERAKNLANQKEKDLAQLQEAVRADNHFIREIFQLDNGTNESFDQNETRSDIRAFHSRALELVERQQRNVNPIISFSYEVDAEGFNSITFDGNQTKEVARGSISDVQTYAGRVEINIDRTGVGLKPWKFTANNVTEKGTGKKLKMEPESVQSNNDTATLSFKFVDKILTVLIILILSSTSMSAQVMGQDMNGFSTIVLPSTNLSIDGANNNVTVSFIQIQRINDDVSNRTEEWTKDLSINSCLLQANHRESARNCIRSVRRDNQKLHKQSNRFILYGIDAKGASKNGIASLLKEERLFANSAQVNGVFGYHFSRIKYRSGDNDIDKYIDFQQHMYNLSGNLNRCFDTLALRLRTLEVHGIVTSDQVDEFLKFTSFKGEEKVPETIKFIQEQIDILENDAFGVTNVRQSEFESLLVSYESIISIVDDATKIFNDSLTPLKIDSLNFLLKRIKDDVLKIDFDRKHYLYPLISITGFEYTDKDEWKSLLDSLIQRKTYLESEISYLKGIGIKGKAIKFGIVDLYKQYITLIDSLDIIKNDFIDSNIGRLNGHRHFIYSRIGLSGRSFMFDLNNGAYSVNNRIEKRNFQGFRFEIGWTYQMKKLNFFGASMASEYSDNFASLSSKTFNFKTIDNTVTPSLEFSDQIVALSGPYDRFHIYSLNVDYVRLVPLRDNSVRRNQNDIPMLYLSINPYIRHNFYVKSETLLPNTSTGLGLYAYKANSNSIAGGIFIQANDLLNANRDVSLDFTEQLSIGLVFKYSLSSFNPK